MTLGTRLIPTLLLIVGAIILLAKPAPVSMPLRGPLAQLPRELEGRSAVDITISDAELKAAGTTAHLMRAYGDSANAAFSLYIGYHAAQSQENQMHSPRNCLPGAGWQVLTTGRTMVNGREVNRFLLELRSAKALVMYWYQGRGRVTADEFQVKLRLFSDAAATGRTEEALVRLVIPIASATEQSKEMSLSEAEAEALGVRLATQLIPEIDKLLPAAPIKRDAQQLTLR